jgi:hypothetical protein
MYSRYEMFGAYERGAAHTTVAADFVLGTPTIHKFDAVASGVTKVRLHFANADITGDSCMTLNGIAVDLAGSSQGSFSQ